MKHIKKGLRILILVLLILLAGIGIGLFGGLPANRFRRRDRSEFKKELKVPDRKKADLKKL